MNKKEENKEVGSGKIEMPRIAKMFGIDENILKSAEAWLDQKIEQKFRQLLEEEKAKIVEAVRQTIVEMLGQARLQAPQSPNPTPTSSPPAQLSPELFAMFAQLLGSGSGLDLKKLAETIALARQIADALNPPSLWDRVGERVMIRLLARQGLITEKEQKMLEKEVSSE